MNVIIAMGILAVFRLLGGFLVRKIKFPAITGYLIIGIFLGTSKPSFVLSNLQPVEESW